METFKKILLVLLGGIVVVGSTVGGFYFFKQMIKTVDSPLTQSANTTPSVPGYSQDLTNKIPSVFPEGLLVNNNIKNTIESFAVAGEKTQYTFRYISTGDFDTTKKYFFNKVRNGFKGWYIKTISEGSNAYFISLIGPKKEEMFITVTIVRADIVVDMTLIK
jgi:uncharacterized protein YxeA